MKLLLASYLLAGLWIAYEAFTAKTDPRDP